jgi:transposase-like protein
MQKIDALKEPLADLQDAKEIELQLKKRLEVLEARYRSLTSLQPQTETQTLPMKILKQFDLCEYLLNLSLPKSFFSMLNNHDYCMSFFLKSGLISTEKRCFDCILPDGSPPSMKLMHFPTRGFEYICQICKKSRNFLSGTIWEKSNLSIDKMLQFLFLWVMDMKIFDISWVINLDRIYVTSLVNKLRKIVSYHFVTTLPKFRGIVEIDESCFFKREGNDIGGAKKETRWVFGLYERETKLTYMQVVPKRTAKILLPIITERCEVGTTIISDQWAAYNKLEDLGFPHYTVDHSRFFVHPHNREIHTQHIELSWCWAKYMIKKKCRLGNNLQEMLNEYCWRRQFKVNKSEKATEMSNIMKSLVEILKIYDSKVPLNATEKKVN